MKHIFRIAFTALFLAFVTVLSSCGGGNALFGGLAPEDGVLRLAVSDGTERKGYTLADDAKKNELLSALGKVSAKAYSGSAHDVPLPSSDSPAYVLSAPDTDGTDFLALFCGGYLVTADRKVFRFDFDLSTVVETYSFAEDESAVWLSDAFGGVTARDGGSFDPLRLMGHDEYMSEHGANFPAVPDGVTASLMSLEDDGGKPVVTVEISNGTGSEFLFGKYYIIETELDGEWYVIPELPDRPVLVEDIALALDPGGSTRMTYSLWNWDLPAGSYRVTIASNLSATFTIE